MIIWGVHCQGFSPTHTLSLSLSLSLSIYIYIFFFFAIDKLVVFVCLACIASRPGQSGRCDGYILEGKELDFYVRKIKAKKTK